MDEMNKSEIALIFEHYISNSSYMKMYNLYDVKYSQENQIDCDELDQFVDMYRRLNKLEDLASSLILIARYYIKQTNYYIATIYLIECYEILRRIDQNSQAQIYVLAQLAILQKSHSEYEEAIYYFSKALDIIILKDYDVAKDYLLKEVTDLVVAARSMDLLERCYNRIQEGKIELKKETKTLLEVEWLYLHKNYEELLDYLEEIQDEHFTQVMRSILKQRKCCVMTKLGKANEIQWLSKKEEELLRHASNLQYNFEYQFIKNQKTLKFSTIEQSLYQGEKYYRLDLFYELMVEVQKDSAYEIKQIENESRLFIKQQMVKVKLQNMHTNYKKYYLNTIKHDFKINHYYVTKHMFIKTYEQPILKKVVLFAISLNQFIAKDISPQDIDQVIKQLPVMGSSVITIAIFDNLIWCHFEANKSMLNTKRELNTIARELYTLIKQPFQIAVCLPTQLKREFNCDELAIHEVFLTQELESPLPNSYSVDYYNPKISKLGPILKANEIIDEAFATGEFYLTKESIYLDSSPFGTRFKLETNRSIDDLLISKNVHALKSLLLIELDFKIIELMCQEITKHQLDGQMFIKLSAETLQYRFVIARILKCINNYNVKKHQIVLEVHEEILFSENLIINHRITELRDLNFNIALDEYGTGTQTGSLTNVKINYLNLSPSLVERLESTNSTPNLLDKVQALCSKEGIYLCYGTVNSEKTHNFISNFGINILSGTYYH